jgi:hypothetical protein
MKRTAIILGALLLPTALAAQLPDASPRSLALAGSYGAMARGFEAVAWNPAMLAARGNPGLTVALPRASFEAGSNTFSWGDLHHYANRHLSDQDKADLMAKITHDDSSLTLRSLFGATPLGLSIGQVGFLVATSGDLGFAAPRDAVELALYGNAHRSGPGESFTAHGTTGRAWAATTVAGSFAWPFSVPLGRLAIGATYKMVIGHFIARASEVASSLVVNPLVQAQGDVHTVYTSYPSGFTPKVPGDIFGGQGKAGSGYGVDLGGALQLAGRSITVSATLVNALGKMTWDQDRLMYERTTYTATQTASGQVSDTTTHRILRTAAEVSADLLAKAQRDSLLANADFSRLLRLGVALRSGALTLSGGAQLRLEEGLDRQPQREVSGGLEYRLLGVVPLRAGLAWDVGNAFTLAGGTGLAIAFFHLDVSAAAITGNLRPGVRFAAGAGLEF